MRSVAGGLGPTTRGAGCEMCNPTCPDNETYGIRVYATEHTDAVLQRMDVQPGYTLVIWRGRHITEPVLFKDTEASTYRADVPTVARALMSHYRPLKMNYKTLGNSLPHLHTHLLPPLQRTPAPGRPFPLLPLTGTGASNSGATTERRRFFHVGYWWAAAPSFSSRVWVQTFFSCSRRRLAAPLPAHSLWQPSTRDRGVRPGGRSPATPGCRRRPAHHPGRASRTHKHVFARRAGLRDVRKSGHAPVRGGLTGISSTSTRAITPCHGGKPAKQAAVSADAKARAYADPH